MSPRPEPIPLCAMAEQDPEIRRAVSQAINRVLDHGAYILGPELAVFEQEAAALCGCRYAVGVSSGSDALYCMLKAAGIGPGQEVVTTAYSFVATAEAIMRTGAAPVFADTRRGEFLPGADQVEQAITPATTAVLAVSLFGQEPHWETLADLCRRRGLKLLLDAAQSFGCGHLGEIRGEKPWLAAAVSFFPSKTLGALGDAGMVLTDAQELFEQAMALRIHGKNTQGHITLLGGNFRMDTLQAAALSAKLPYLAAHREMRRQVAASYATLMQELVPDLLPGIHPLAARPLQAQGRHGFSYFLLTLPRGRDEARAVLAREGIHTGLYYGRPLPYEQVFAPFARRPNKYPNAEESSAAALALPLFPALDLDRQQRVVATLARWWRQATS